MKRCIAPLWTRASRWSSARRRIGHWRPVSLRWRRAARSVGAVAAASHPSITHNDWTLQLHFHGSAASLPRSSGPAPRLTRGPALLHWSQPPITATTAALAWRIAQGASSFHGAPSQAPIGRRSAKSNGRAARSDQATAPARSAMRTPRAQAAAPAAARRSADIRMRVHQPARLAASIAVAAPPRQLAGASAAIAPARAELPSVQRRDAIPLHWRSKGVAVSAATTAPGSDSLVSRHSAARVESVVARTAMPPARAAASAREASRSHPLDAATADRLVDDVVRRIEKRVRIERERRGL